MRAIVVSDTSPLRGLRHLTLLHVLDAFFKEVLIPPAVENELRAALGDPAVQAIRGQIRLRVQAPTDRARVIELQQYLDPGESEALALALETKTPTILIDEADGRRAAMSLGLTPVGLLGLLARGEDGRHRARDQAAHFASSSGIAISFVRASGPRSAPQRWRRRSARIGTAQEGSKDEPCPRWRKEF